MCSLDIPSAGGEADFHHATLLPRGGEILLVKRHGATNWSAGYKVTVRMEGKDQDQSFFLKLTSREDAVKMAEGEYESAAALYQSIPGHSCLALAWGTLESDLKSAFFLTLFRDINPAPVKVKDLVPPEELAVIMRKMHSSVSPTGKFGFQVPTFKGYTPIDNTWWDTWEEYYTRMFNNDISWEQSVRGDDPEFNKVAEEFFAKVVPRLLRPMETGGRKIDPVLIHGDLWVGNIAFDGDTPVIYDACCYYGHREVELAAMITSGYMMKREYIDKYISLVVKSERKEDFWDRMKIYTMCFDITVAGAWPRWAHLRGDVKKQMQELLVK